MVDVEVTDLLFNSLSFFPFGDGSLSRIIINFGWELPRALTYLVGLAVSLRVQGAALKIFNFLIKEWGGGLPRLCLIRKLFPHLLANKQIDFLHLLDRECQWIQLLLIRWGLGFFSLPCPGFALGWGQEQPVGIAVALLLWR